MAVDWVSRLIFWADASNQLIGVITMNTSAYWRPVVDSGLTEPQDVAVNAIDRSEIIIGTHIVIVNSRRLERPQKRSRGNQLIHRRLSKTKSTVSGQDPESQAGRHTVRRLCWMVFGV